MLRYVDVLTESVLRTARKLVPGRGVSTAAEDTFVGPAAADNDEEEDWVDNGRFTFGRDDCDDDDEEVDNWESEEEDKEERGSCSAPAEVARSHSAKVSSRASDMGAK